MTLKRWKCIIPVFVLWLLLFWSLEASVIVGGLVLSALVVWAMGDRFVNHMDKMLHPHRWLFLAVYIPYFLYYCIKANLDVMLRVIHPDVPIRPGIVKVRTTLTTEMGKTFLANSITLTPGTLTVDIDGQDLYVHWINISTDDPKQRTAEICGRFEPLLRRIFE